MKLKCDELLTNVCDFNCCLRHYSTGVVLKGDLPIGVDKASVDTWMYPDLFRMSTSTAGLPHFGHFTIFMYHVMDIPTK